MTTTEFARSLSNEALIKKLIEVGHDMAVLMSAEMATINPSSTLGRAIQNKMSVYSELLEEIFVRDIYDYYLSVRNGEVTLS